MGQEGPEKRHPLPPGDGGEDEEVDLGPADRPPAAVGGERTPGWQVGDDDEPPVGEALGGEAEGRPARAPRPQAAAEGAGLPRPVRAGVKGELAAVLGDHAEVLPEAD